MRRVEDITGKTFGLWKVIEYVRTDKHGHIFWLCECNCEKKTRREVAEDSLKNGRSASCGCETIKHTIKMGHDNKKFNEYEIVDSNTMRGRFYNSEYYFYFDKEDFDKIKEFCWHYSKNGYVYSNDKNRKKINIDQVILGKEYLEDDLVIDHADRDPLNNRKSNLRITSENKNAINKKIRSDNTTGIIGTTWDKSRNKWMAQLALNQKHIYLGRYDNFYDAVVARLKGELEYFGLDFAPQRHLFAEYGII